MRRFHLERDEDATGVSGTGYVAEGVLWSNGWVSMTWLTQWTSVVTYPQGIEAVEYIHGHQGMTRVVWDDPEE